MNIPNTGTRLHNLAKEFGVSISGTDAQIKNRVISHLKKQGWKHF